MDKKKGLDLLENIKGREIEGVTIEVYINCGKSAAVFCGDRAGDKYAVKIFDNDLVEKYGVELQEKRIKLELSLKDHHISNLVKIIGGGMTTIESIQYHYIVMEYIEGTNLKEFIQANAIETQFIVRTITTLIETTEQLISNDPPLAHRDIKPENIMVRKNNEITLMDLGVLRIIESPSMTDVDEKQFLATLRYAPPELLTRKEENTEDGWRAINIYQIGAVMHDLIMRKELFKGIEPYPNLVIEIKENMPKIINDTHPPDVVQLCRNMLSKDWKKRLELCPIGNIKEILNSSTLPKSTSAVMFDEIKKSSAVFKEEFDEISRIVKTEQEKEKVRNETNALIMRFVKECMIELRSVDVIKSIEDSPTFKNDAWQVDHMKTENIFFEIEGTLDCGFSRQILILFRVSNNENGYCKILIGAGIWPKHKALNIKSQNDIMSTLYPPPPKVKTTYPGSRPAIKERPFKFFKCAFDGTFEPGDANFKEEMKKTAASIIQKAMEIMHPEVQSELALRKQQLSHKGSSATVTIGPVMSFTPIEDF